MSLLPTNQRPTQLDVDKRKALADALMKAQMPQGQMAGRFYVAPSPWAQAATGLSNVLGAWQQGKAGKEQGMVDEDWSAKFTDALIKSGSDPAAVESAQLLPIEQKRALLGQITATKLAPKQRQLQKVSAGETVIDDSGKTVYSAPAAPTKLSNNERLIGPDNKPIVDAVPQFEKVDGGDSWVFTDQQGKEVNRISKAASPDAILQAGTTRRGQDITSQTAQRGQDITASTALAGQGAQADKTARRDTASLRKEFRGLQTVKDYEASLPIVETARSAPDTPAGDLQVIYSVGKVLDPNSVVREGELQLTQNATPFLQKIIGKARAELSGQGRLTPTTRANLVDMLDQRVKGYEQAYTRDYDTYSQYAGDVGAQSDQIVGVRPETAFGRTTAPAQDSLPSPTAQVAAAGGVPPTPRVEAPPAALQFLQGNPSPENKAQFQAKFGYLPPGM